MSLSRQQLTLLGIFALFLGPVILVIMMRSSWWQYQPAGLKNHGYLVQPPVALALGEMPATDGKWLILYVLKQPCDEACIDYVSTLRQIHRAAGRNASHLAVVLLTGSQVEPALRARLEAIYPEFIVSVDAGRSALGTLDAINTGLTTDGADIRTYVLDPMHNVVLAYETSAAPTDIHKDLKRLLKYSDQEGKS
jgi:hypothetical protein